MSGRGGRGQRGGRGHDRGGRGGNRGRGSKDSKPVRVKETEEQRQARKSYSSWKRRLGESPEDATSMRRLWDGAVGILEAEDRDWRQQVPQDLDEDEGMSTKAFVQSWWLIVRRRSSAYPWPTEYQGLWGRL
jgi:hypothetical protein